MKTIEIIWEGPIDFRQVENLKDKKDYGVYQVYGKHRIYGGGSSNVLLYIGQANSHSFSERMPDHDDWWDWDENNIKMYVGRIKDWEKLESKEWEEQIHLAEAALIMYCLPSWNSSGKQQSKKLRVDFTVINTDSKYSLPEQIVVKDSKILCDEFDSKAPETAAYLFSQIKKKQSYVEYKDTVICAYRFDIESLKMELEVLWKKYAIAMEEVEKEWYKDPKKR